MTIWKCRILAVIVILLVYINPRTIWLNLQILWLTIQKWNQSVKFDYYRAFNQLLAMEVTKMRKR